MSSNITEKDDTQALKLIQRKPRSIRNLIVAEPGKKLMFPINLRCTNCRVRIYNIEEYLFTLIHDPDPEPLVFCSSLRCREAAQQRAKSSNISFTKSRSIRVGVHSAPPPFNCSICKKDFPGTTYIDCGSCSRAKFCGECLENGKHIEHEEACKDPILDCVRLYSADQAPYRKMFKEQILDVCKGCGDYICLWEKAHGCVECEENKEPTLLCYSCIMISKIGGKIPKHSTQHDPSIYEVTYVGQEVTSVAKKWTCRHCSSAQQSVRFKFVCRSCNLDFCTSHPWCPSCKVAGVKKFGITAIIPPECVELYSKVVANCQGCSRKINAATQPYYRCKSCVSQNNDEGGKVGIFCNLCYEKNADPHLLQHPKGPMFYWRVIVVFSDWPEDDKGNDFWKCVGPCGKTYRWTLPFFTRRYDNKTVFNCESCCWTYGFQLPRNKAPKPQAPDKDEIVYEVLGAIPAGLKSLPVEGADGKAFDSKRRGFKLLMGELGRGLVEIGKAAAEGIEESRRDAQVRNTQLQQAQQKQIQALKGYKPPPPRVVTQRQLPHGRPHLHGHPHHKKKKLGKPGEEAEEEADGDMGDMGTMDFTGYSSFGMDIFGVSNAVMPDQTLGMQIQTPMYGSSGIYGGGDMIYGGGFNTFGNMYGANMYDGGGMYGAGGFGMNNFGFDCGGAGFGGGGFDMGGGGGF